VGNHVTVLLQKKQAEDLLAASEDIVRRINIGKPYISGKLQSEEWVARSPARKTDELIALAKHYKKQIKRQHSVMT